MGQRERLGVAVVRDDEGVWRREVPLLRSTSQRRENLRRRRGLEDTPEWTRDTETVTPPLLSPTSPLQIPPPSVRKRTSRVGRPGWRRNALRERHRRRDPDTGQDDTHLPTPLLCPYTRQPTPWNYHIRFWIYSYAIFEQYYVPVQLIGANKPNCYYCEQ